MHAKGDMQPQKQQTENKDLALTSPDLTTASPRTGRAALNLFSQTFCL